MGMGWIPDPGALDLLLTPRGPFAAPACRNAVVQAGLGWRDLSVGGVLEDGTRAALPLLAAGRSGDSLPFGYGGIVATRKLSALETSTFLEMVARQGGLRVVSVRAIPPLGAIPAHAGGTVIASTHLVPLDPMSEPARAFAPKAAQSIRRAIHAGCEVRVGADPRAALTLYRDAAAARRIRYPDVLVRLLAEAGVAFFYDVWIGTDPIATVVTLRNQDHWMYWIAAQNALGRKVEAGYLALSRMIQDAHAAGAQAVNLGASAGLPGVAMFKRRLGGIEVPVIEYRFMSRLARWSPSGRITRRVRASARRVLRARASVGLGGA